MARTVHTVQQFFRLGLAMGALLVYVAMQLDNRHDLEYNNGRNNRQSRNNDDMMGNLDSRIPLMADQKALASRKRMMTKTATSAREHNTTLLTTKTTTTLQDGTTTNTTTNSLPRQHPQPQQPQLQHSGPGSFHKNIVWSDNNNNNNNNNGLEFVHITKTGGSAVEEAAARVGIAWGLCHFQHKGFLGVGCTNPDWTFPHPPHLNRRTVPNPRWDGELWHTPPQWLDPNPYHSHTTFTIVRDPYERVISEYYCKFFGQFRDEYAQQQQQDDGDGGVRGFRPKRNNKNKRNHQRPQEWLQTSSDDNDNYKTRSNNKKDLFAKVRNIFDQDDDTIQVPSSGGKQEEEEEEVSDQKRHEAVQRFKQDFRRNYLAARRNETDEQRRDRQTHAAQYFRQGVEKAAASAMESSNLTKSSSSYRYYRQRERRRRLQQQQQDDNDKGNNKEQQQQQQQQQQQVDWTQEMDSFQWQRQHRPKTTTKRRGGRRRAKVQDSPETLCRWVRRRLRPTLDVRTGHLLPQSYYVFDQNGTQMVDYVLRYETLQRDFAQLMDRFNLSHVVLSEHHRTNTGHLYHPPPPHDNNNNNHNNSSSSSGGGQRRLTPDDFDEKTLEAINARYKRDFVLLGYPMRTP